MYKFFLRGPILEFSTLFLVYLIISSVINVNYLKVKTKKNKPYLVYTILIIEIGLLFSFILYAIKELGKYDSVQVHLAFWLRIIEFLPYILLVLIIFLVKNIHGYKTGKEKINLRFVTSILIIMTILVVYYLPHRNIINIPADKLYLSAYKSGVGDRTVDSQDEAERLLEIINKYSFTRTTRKSIKGLKSDNISMDVSGSVKGRLYVFKVIKYDNNETILEINYNPYKVKDQNKFDQEIFNMVN
jgi:hypothetical protein